MGLCLVTQSYPTLCDPMDHSLPGSSVHGILQARILEWVAMPSSRGSFQPRDQTQVSCIVDRFFTDWATREAHTYIHTYTHTHTHTYICIKLPIWHFKITSKEHIQSKGLTTLRKIIFYLVWNLTSWILIIVLKITATILVCVYPLLMYCFDQIRYNLLGEIISILFVCYQT